MELVKSVAREYEDEVEFVNVEPYLFVVDADGNVFARFEGVVGGDELRAAIEDALDQAA